MDFFFRVILEVRKRQEYSRKIWVFVRNSERANCKCAQSTSTSTATASHNSRRNKNAIIYSAKPLRIQFCASHRLQNPHVMTLVPRATRPPPLRALGCDITLHTLQDEVLNVTVTPSHTLHSTSTPAKVHSKPFKQAFRPGDNTISYLKLQISDQRFAECWQLLGAAKSSGQFCLHNSTSLSVNFDAVSRERQY